MPTDTDLLKDLHSNSLMTLNQKSFTDESMMVENTKNFTTETKLTSGDSLPKASPMKFSKVYPIDLSS